MSNPEETPNPEEVSISSLGEDYPDPSNEDDIIGRMDARREAHKLFASGEVPDRYKVVLALRHGVLPLELKGVKVDAGDGKKTLGEAANALPDNTRGVTQEDVADVFGVNRVRIHQMEQDGFRAARGVVNPPPRRRPWL